MGRMHLPPAPDIRFTGLKCRMEHFVSGMNVAVVVAVEYPEPGLAVVTVIDITKIWRKANYVPLHRRRAAQCVAGQRL